jgi:two-component system, response regulator PdtaR
MKNSTFLKAAQPVESTSPDGGESAGVRVAAVSLQGEKRRVLIVEDDFLIAMEAEAALSNAGFDVLEIATTAEQAFASAKLHKPAIALMDVRLAGRRDGVDAAGDLFRELALRCIFATAQDDQQTRARAEPYEPLGWLTKPYSMASLVNLVRAALSGSN